jgi:Mn2+/Fe2+ NRAMP family transporter
VRFLGPGLILSAAIVGSGELIATTTMGAQAGYVLLWVILLACLFKVAIQLEYGRFCIIHGKPSFQAWNDGGRYRLLGMNASLYAALLFMVLITIGQGGVIGGAAQVGLLIFPSLTIYGWTLLLAGVCALLIFHGRYAPIEWLAIAMNTVFIAVLFYCLLMVQRTPYAFSVADVASGFTFRLPPEGAVMAMSVFGIVGLGAGEIVFYPYWCIEKGYAAWTGPDDGSPAWAARARGWVRVMKMDALVSMVVYTVSTCAFYLLGAAVLRTEETIAQDGNQFILKLSSLFTEILGPQARVIFMIGAFTVLFSTAFANTAGFSRMWTDWLGISGLFDPNHPAARRRSLAILAWILPFSWAAAYLFMQKPWLMVVIMGVSNTLFLIVVSYKALVFRYRYPCPALRPTVWYDIALWIGFFTINFVGIHALIKMQ